MNSMVSVAEYKSWLLSEGMSESQARIIAPVMHREQLPMSVAIVLGIINANTNDQYALEQAKKNVRTSKQVIIRERFEM